MDFRSLLPVQATDFRIAQLEHRKAQLPEHADAATAQKGLAAVCNFRSWNIYNTIFSLFHSKIIH